MLAPTVTQDLSAWQVIPQKYRHTDGIDLRSEYDGDMGESPQWEEVSQEL